MKIKIFSLAATVFVVSVIFGCAGAPVGDAQPRNAPAKRKMRAFRSEGELASFLRKLAEEQKRAVARRQSANMNTAAAPTAGAANETVTVASGDIKSDDSITNVQHAGVDEGGIVKLHGQHLVVLRRGRLFTIAIGDGDLKPVSSVNAFAPDVDPRGDWYDEMLVSGNTIIVIGYSYARGGTEINLFRIDADGDLSYRSTYHLRSNDYYSSRNYASRLIGGKLVFYTPSYLSLESRDYSQSFPAIRKWRKGAGKNEFRSVVSATRVYRSEQPVNSTYGLALHTVTVCDLARGEMACEGTTVVGPSGRVFYVSPESVYVWTRDWAREESDKRARSMLYRMPLNGSAPSALGASGSPVDQFSFLESEDGHLNVLVRSEAVGDGMWGAEVSAGDVALMRVPLGSFSDGSDAAPRSSYRKLPKPEGYTFQNRFVADQLLYGTGSGWGLPERKGQSSLYAVRWAGGGDASELSLAHGVDRIEVMGRDAVVVGTDGRDLHFTSVRLGERPEIADRYTRKGASQGELRSHGFFYKAEDTDSGLLGLPVRAPGRPGYEHLFEQSASLLFLRNDSLRLTQLGELAAQPERASDDGCRASCVDWYGNARPLFVRNRVFALLGYEMVEGTLNDGRIRETRRVSFAPRSLKSSGR